MVSLQCSDSKAFLCKLTMTPCFSVSSLHTSLHLICHLSCECLHASKFLYLIIQYKICSYLCLQIIWIKCTIHSILVINDNNSIKLP